MKDKNKIIEKLIEIIMHVGGLSSESFTIDDVVKEMERIELCPECLKLASELAALKSKDKRKES